MPSSKSKRSKEQMEADQHKAKQRIMMAWLGSLFGTVFCVGEDIMSELEAQQIMISRWLYEWAKHRDMPYAIIVGDKPDGTFSRHSVKDKDKARMIKALERTLARLKGEEESTNFEIRFPEEEVESIKQDFLARGYVYTTRIQKELGKYHVGQVLYSPDLGYYMLVSRVERLDRVRNHPFYVELNERQREALRHEDMDVIKLVPFKG